MPRRQMGKCPSASLYKRITPTPTPNHTPPQGCFDQNETAEKTRAGLLSIYDPLQYKV